MLDILHSLTTARLPRLPLFVLLVTVVAVQGRVHGQATPPHTLYFAEGATGFFTTSIDLINPSASDTATATMTFVGDSGPVGTRTITLGPGTSQSISLDAEVGTAGGYGTIVESDIELAGERRMSWGEGGYGSSLERGVRQASATWYFAEGSTTLFDLYYLLLNPGTTAADVTIRFLRDDGPPITRTARVAPRSRTTVRILDFSDPELQAASFGAVLTSTVPIVAEQAMYQSSQTQYFGAGAASAATPTLATTVHFAEGATGPFFDEFLLLINPSPAAAATATILYRLPDGTTLLKAYAIEPERRLTVWLNQEARSDPALAALASTAVAVTVTSDIPIAVTRKMYWPTPQAPDGWGEASDAAGFTTTTLEAYIARAIVGGTDQAETYVLIANTSADAGQIQITLTPAAGAPVVRTYPIAGNARLTVDLAWFGIVDQPCRVVIESLASPQSVPIVVEVAEYTSPGGTFWAAGSASAASVPATPPGTGAPTFTSATSTTFTVGSAGTFTVTTDGTPTAAITVAGALPPGVTFVDHGDGTGTLSGTPAADTGGVAVLTFTAANGVLPNAEQAFTLTVHQAPAIASAATATFSVGTAGAFTVTTSGVPAPALIQEGSLPTGVTFTDNGNGTGTLAGTPAAGTAGSYALTFTATNVVGTSAAQAFVLTVTQPSPTLTSVAPNQGSQGSTVAVTLTGTDFVAGATTVAVGGSGVTVTDVVVSSLTALTATFVIDQSAPEGFRTVTVTTAGGTSGPRFFTVSLPAPGVPTLTSITPNSGTQGTTVAVTLTGTDFVMDATTVAVSGGDVTVTNVVVRSPMSLTADLVLGAAAVGPRSVTVTTTAGTSGPQDFTVVVPAPPTLTSIAPNHGIQGTTVAVTLTGADFVVGATTVTVGGSGVTVADVVVSSGTSLTANFVLDPIAAVGPRPVTVTTATGTSTPRGFAIDLAPPTLTGVSPNQGTPGNTVAVTLSGTNFVGGATTVSVGGADVTVTNVIVGSPTSLTASFVLDPAAAAGARAVTVTTAGGTSGAQPFTVNAPPAPTLTGVSPDSGLRGETIAVTLTGTNFIAGATTVAVAGGGVTVTNVVVGSSTSLSATFVLDLAADGPRSVTVTTAGGTSGPQPFTIRLPSSGIRVFAPTDGPQTFTVPAGVVSVLIETVGARGGGSNGANAGRAVARVSVVPGTLLTVRVGGAGQADGAGGFNGGGGSTGTGGSGGGGATSVHDGATPLVIAGGGGGGGVPSTGGGGRGGLGGGLTAGDASTVIAGGRPGRGGGQLTGGAGGAAGGSATATDGTAGTAGMGGTGGSDQPGVLGGGGGGGGYFGGGGGGGGTPGTGGGGGGSSFTAPGATEVLHQRGSSFGASVVISW